MSNKNYNIPEEEDDCNRLASVYLKTPTASHLPITHGNQYGRRRDTWPGSENAGRKAPWARCRPLCRISVDERLWKLCLRIPSIYAKIFTDSVPKEEKDDSYYSMIVELRQDRRKVESVDHSNFLNPVAPSPFIDVQWKEKSLLCNILGNPVTFGSQLQK